ncbi:MAG: helix-turn-helix domain-containing protein [Lachnospiraceae bacterium]|nr:helix-turn-helix domain-containing protein [Lachnospiraceae bacterium]
MNPDYLDRIQLALDYMEQNLKTDIHMRELSDAAGYSESYYGDLFRKATGLPVRQYLVRRRLAHAIWEISSGRKMLDAALEYGFDTYAGFYRAFCREYGCSPSEYLKSRHPVRPYRIDLKQEEKILLMKKGVQGLLAHWGMEQETIGEIYYEGSGRVSESDFLIGEDHILKISAMPGGLKRHAHISQALVESGLHIPMPVPAKDGNLVVRDGNIFCMLCRKVPGVRLNSGKLLGRGGETEAARFGELIGKLHLALGGLDPDFCQENTLYDSVRTWAMKEVRKRGNLPLSFVVEYERNFGRIYEKLPKQIIHRNMNLSYVFLEEGRMTGITDFELSEYCIRLFDPCYAATGILSENFTDEAECISKWLPLYRGILRGYDGAVHLTEEERNALPYVVLSIQLICTAYFSRRMKYRELAGINERMLMRLLENKEALCFEAI